MAKKKLTFETAVEQLEHIVTTLDENNTTLLESLELYKKGVELSVFASACIDNVEKEVLVLSESKKGDFKVTEFENILDKD
jgi:exodeoxyribonuclease VII small subunit